MFLFPFLFFKGRKSNHLYFVTCYAPTLKQQGPDSITRAHSVINAQIYKGYLQIWLIMLTVAATGVQF